MLLSTAYISEVSFVFIVISKLRLLIYVPQQVGTTDLDEKRTNVLNELYQTEQSYLKVLEIISQEFYSALVDHISSEDAELLFSAAKVCKLA